MGYLYREALKSQVEFELDKLKPEHYSDELSSYRVKTLKSTLFKKWSGGQASQNLLHQEALLRFEATVNRVRNHVIDVDDRILRYIRDEAHALFLCDEMQNNRLETLVDCMQYGKTGPGKSVACPENDFFTKMFNSGLSTTSFSLYETYVGNLSEQWLPAETNRRQLHSVQHVAGSKLGTVDKDVTKRRVICTEPVLNMFFQLGAKSIIESCLRDVHNLDVKKQQFLNRDLACAGSINGRFSTIDLSDASDSILVTFLESILPGSTFRTLMKMRSPYAVLPGSPDLIELPMISTMGNGYTFALMTSVFSCIVRALYRIHDIHPRNGINYAVYGDDIICLSQVTPMVLETLRRCGFVTNDDKTFTTGNFRESCGGDYLSGHDVRGVYIKELSNHASIYSSYNRLADWSTRHSIDLSGILGVLVGSVPIRFVPQQSPIDSGLRSPRETVWFYPRDKNGAIRYRSLEARQRRVPITTIYERNPLTYHGLLVAFLGGYVKGCSIMRPLNSVSYKVKARIDPVWEIPYPYKRLLASFPKGSELGVFERSPCWFYNQEHAVTVRRSLERHTLRMLEGS
jgi:hypothetical protein